MRVGCHKFCPPPQNAGQREPRPSFLLVLTNDVATETHEEHTVQRLQELEGLNQQVGIRGNPPGREA